MNSGTTMQSSVPTIVLVEHHLLSRRKGTIWTQQDLISASLVLTILLVEQHPTATPVALHLWSQLDTTWSGATQQAEQQDLAPRTNHRSYNPVSGAWVRPCEG